MTVNILNECIKITSENTQDSFIYNVVKDFVFPLLLALIGAFAAWLVFIRQLVNDKKNEIKSKKEDIHNRLTYFSLIVNNAIENSKGQNKNIKLLVSQINQSTINFVPLSKYPTYDLNLIAEKIDKEDYLLSYLKFYSKKNKMKTLNEFKEILDSCGIINDIFQQIESDLESKQVFEFKLKEEFSNSLSNWSSAIGESLVFLKNTNDPLFYELIKINKNSEDIKGLYSVENIKNQYNKLLKPTLTILNKANSEQKEFDENVGNLWVLTSDTINIYDNLKLASLQIGTMLTEQNNYIDKQIDLLEKASLKIRNEFLS